MRRVLAQVEGSGIADLISVWPRLSNSAWGVSVKIARSVIENGPVSEAGPEPRDNRATIRMRTNIRNVSSPHWRGWLEARNRCLVPATSFCEYADTKPRKTPTWFALSEDRPLFAFAGLWTRWRGVRGPKSAPVEGEHELFGFLTTEANAIVAPIHPKAMPVILTTTEEFDLWLEGETVEALKLQRPLPDGMLDIVARGEKEDRAPAIATVSK